MDMFFRNVYASTGFKAMEANNGRIPYGMLTKELAQARLMCPNIENITKLSIRGIQITFPSEAIIKIFQI